jgi:hypothetical protein
MIEPQVRALFDQIAEGEAEPSRVDTHLALRRGRARLRWRRACVAGAPVLAAAVAAVVALAVAAGPFRTGASPAGGAGPAAPRQFSALIPNGTFGWLPAGEALQQGGVRPGEAYMAAGSPADFSSWSLGVYARGRCHLTGSPGALTCPSPALAA